MRVLVTGHLGYLGAEMVPRLLRAGHEVVGLDTGLFEGCDFALPPVRIPELRIDLRDVTCEHLAGFEAVVHLAALSNDPWGDLDPSITYEVNLHGSIRLAAAARRAGVERFVFASSCSTYGAGGDGLLDEGSPLRPVTAYGDSKVGVEQQLTGLADDRFSPVSLRNATAYGVSRRLRADLVVNDLVARAVTTGVVRLTSDGSAWRPLVHLDDIGLAVECCLAAPRDVIHGRAFNVGRTGENYQIRDLAELVAEIVPDSRVEIGPGASADVRDYRVSFETIETTLPGYRPTWHVARGIEELYHAFIAGGLTADEWESSRFRRLATISELQSSGRLDARMRWARQSVG